MMSIPPQTITLLQLSPTPSDRWQHSLDWKQSDGFSKPELGIKTSQAAPRNSVIGIKRKSKEDLTVCQIKNIVNGVNNVKTTFIYTEYDLSGTGQVTGCS